MEINGEDTVKVVLFCLGDETYGVTIGQVLSIEQLQSVTRVPNAADFVEGVMNLRGSIIPVIDVRKRLQMGSAKVTKDSRIIIAESNDLQVGLLVDSAKEVLDIDKQTISKTPDIVGGVDARFISGVAEINEGDLLILLNLERILNDEQIDELKKIEG